MGEAGAPGCSWDYADRAVSPGREEDQVQELFAHDQGVADRRDQGVLGDVEHALWWLGLPQDCLSDCGALHAVLDDGSAVHTGFDQACPGVVLGLESGGDEDGVEGVDRERGSLVEEQRVRLVVDVVAVVLHAVAAVVLLGQVENLVDLVSRRSATRQVHHEFAGRGHVDACLYAGDARWRPTEAPGELQCVVAGLLAPRAQLVAQFPAERADLVRWHYLPPPVLITATGRAPLGDRR